jgi:hypothetical protein
MTARLWVAKYLRFGSSERLVTQADVQMLNDCCNYSMTIHIVQKTYSSRPGCESFSRCLRLEAEHPVNISSDRVNGTNDEVYTWVLYIKQSLAQCRSNASLRQCTATHQPPARTRPHRVPHAQPLMAHHYSPVPPCRLHCCACSGDCSHMMCLIATHQVRTVTGPQNTDV